ncbi:MAG: hypothetical protein WB791_08575 [Waddliaceae bacterium]
MMRRVMSLFLPFFSLLNIAIFWRGAEAQELSSLFRQAEARFQAKDYAQAREIFQTIERENLASWQRARLRYNMGTVWLAEKRWNEALETFSTIPFSPETAPLLSRRLKTNMAAAFFRQAADMRSQDTLTLEGYSRALYLYREALINIRAAEEADCILQTMEGKKSCQPSYDLNQWEPAIKTELARTTQAFGEAKIREASLREGLPFLLSDVNRILEHIDFLATITLNDKLKNRYREFILHGAESWLPLWDAQEKKNKEVEKPKAFFVEGLTAMENDQPADSRRALSQSAEALSQLIHTLWGMDPSFDLLRELLTFYSRALDQIPLQAGALYQLQTEQEHIQNAMESRDIVGEEFSLSDENLTKSLRLLQQGKPVDARFYLEEARQWIYRLLRKTVVKPKPDEILEHAIQEQSHALALNRLSQEMTADQEETAQHILQSQENTLGIVAPFLDAVIEMEKEDYPVRCQDQPWNVTIPLFIQGLLSAEDSKETLEATNKAAEAMSSQEEAVRYWKEALENMRHPREEEKEEEAPPQEGPAPEPEEAPVQDVLRLLQQMEREDRGLRPEGVTVPKEGERPW